MEHHCVDCIIGNYGGDTIEITWCFERYDQRYRLEQGLV